MNLALFFKGLEEKGLDKVLALTLFCSDASVFRTWRPDGIGIGPDSLV
jgi:hypothetical protein